MSSENLRRNALGEAHKKLGGSVELQVLAVAWGRGLVPDLHKERWTPEKRLNSKVGPPTGPSQMSLVLLDGQVLEMINDMASSLGGGIKNLVGWPHTKATLGSFHMLGKDAVQITPHRTHACAHFFVACHTSHNSSNAPALAQDVCAILCVCLQNHPIRAPCRSWVFLSSPRSLLSLLRRRH